MKSITSIRLHFHFQFTYVFFFISFSFSRIRSDEYDKHPNEVVKNEELTYNNNAGHSLMGSRARFSRLTYASFLFSWMPQQLLFILLALCIVFLINYLSIFESNRMSIFEVHHTDAMQATIATTATITATVTFIDKRNTENGLTTAISNNERKRLISRSASSNFDYYLNRYDNYDITQSDFDKTNETDQNFIVHKNSEKNVNTISLITENNSDNNINKIYFSSTTDNTNNNFNKINLVNNRNSISGETHNGTHCSFDNTSVHCHR